MAVEEILHWCTVRVHSGGLCPLDITSKSNFLRLGVSELAFVNEPCLTSTCFSKDDKFGHYSVSHQHGKETPYRFH